MKLSDGRMRLASLMLVFLFSKATGQYCQTYFRLLIIVAAFLWQSLQLPRGPRYIRRQVCVKLTRMTHVSVDFDVCCGNILSWRKKLIDFCKIVDSVTFSLSILVIQ